MRSRSKQGTRATAYYNVQTRRNLNIVLFLCKLSYRLATTLQNRRRPFARKKPTSTSSWSEMLWNRGPKMAPNAAKTQPSSYYSSSELGYRLATSLEGSSQVICTKDHLPVGRSLGQRCFETGTSKRAQTGRDLTKLLAESFGTDL